MPLIVGLGNPGDEYRETPHNVGFEVTAKLADRAGIRFRRSRAGKAEEAVWPAMNRVILFRPLAFMNLSGGVVAAALRWHHFTIQDLLVVCDDVNLPPGQLRMRSKGGAGGQKGLLSIIETLGTEDFARLRIGVGGGEPGADVARHVLNRFPPEVREIVNPVLDQAVDAVECYLHDGLEIAMNRFNTKRTSQDNNNPSGGDPLPDKNSP
ncbi:aminoacyl-tRNA hydrolase [candidate division KSB1 bacterium]|nr:MAG: aminoacyl-tRNA hydrolase [candidate division KSB1 bacterium]